MKVLSLVQVIAKNGIFWYYAEQFKTNHCPWQEASVVIFDLAS